MLKACSVFLFFICSILVSYSDCYGQYYGLVKVSLTYMDKKPKVRGTLLTVSDSSVQVVVKVANSVRRANPGGKRKAYLTDTLTIDAAQIAYMRVGLKSSKWRVAPLTSLALMYVGLASGFIVGLESDQDAVLPVIMGAAVSLAFGAIGLVAGFPLGFLVNDFTKKKYTINGDIDTYQKSLFQLRGYK